MQRPRHSSVEPDEPPGESEQPPLAAVRAGGAASPASDPVDPAPLGPLIDEPEPPEAPPSTHGIFRRILLGIVILIVLVIAVRIAAPHVEFLNDSWQKVRQGDPVWLIGAALVEVLSFLGYVWVFNATARRAGLRLPRFTSWRIVLAGVAATRLLATAGAGGIASTTFALRRQGLDARQAAATVAAQIAIIYVWFILLIALTGFGLFLFGHGHAAITIVPAGIAAGLLLLAAGGRPLLRRLAAGTARRKDRAGRWLATIPSTLDDAVHTVSTLVRERDASILGGALWWLADAAVLWAACHAFGASPNMVDVLMAYLIGQVANLLPIPGGLGVEAGLLGMLIAFGVPGGVAVLASLAQRLISTWLPALPGAVALVAIGRPSPDAELVPVVSDDRPPGSASASA